MFKNIHLASRCFPLWTFVFIFIPLLAVASRELYTPEDVIKPYDESMLQYTEGRTIIPPEEAEGKIIRHLWIITREIAEQEDVYPEWMNLLHITTHRYVLEMEILQKEGEPFNEQLMDNSVRNMKEYPSSTFADNTSISDARYFVMEAPDDQVDVLVATKDVWSTIPIVLPIGGGGESFIAAGILENNLFGFGTRLVMGGIVTNGQYMFGMHYADKRFLRTRWILTQSFGLLITRDEIPGKYEKGDVEGIINLTQLEYPLFAPYRQWHYDLGIKIWIGPRRYYSGKDLKIYEKIDPETGTIDGSTYLWDRQNAELFTGLKRSFGQSVKHDIGMGVGLKRVDNVTETINPSATEFFRRTVLEPYELAVFPYVSYSVYFKNYNKRFNFKGFGVEEQIKLGWQLDLKLSFSHKYFFADNEYLKYELAAFYDTFFLGDNYLSLALESQNRFELSGVNQYNWYQSIYSVQFIYYSPYLYIGRFTMQATYKYGDNLDAFYIARDFSIGGSLSEDRAFFSTESLVPTIVRGYPSNYKWGETGKKNHFGSFSVEFRSIGIDFQRSLYLGLILFYDSGYVSTSFKNFRDYKNNFYKSVGLGLRIFLPQIQNTILRFDIGFPLVSNVLQEWDPDLNGYVEKEPGFATQISFGFYHVF